MPLQKQKAFQRIIIKTVFFIIIKVTERTVGICCIGLNLVSHSFAIARLKNEKYFKIQRN